MRKSTELLWHKTLDFTSDMQPPNRPDLNPVNYGISIVIHECIYQKQQGTWNIINELWLLTQWCIIFHKVGQKHPSGEVAISVAVLLQIYFSICVPKIIKIWCSLTWVIAKISGCDFFASLCSCVCYTVKRVSLTVSVYCCTVECALCQRVVWSYEQMVQGGGVGTGVNQIQ